jgi:deoxycytidylate deaminase
MINAGIIKIVYNEEYAGEESETDKIMRDLLKESSVILEKYDGRIPQITFTDEKEEKGKITLE